MAKTRTELDAELNAFAVWMPAMLAETEHTDQLDAFAGRAELAAWPGDGRHVHERLQRLLVERCLIRPTKTRALSHSRIRPTR